MKHSDKTKVEVINQHGPFGFVMFVAFIGAFVYFARDMKNIGDFLYAFIQAVVWPGIATYHFLMFLHA
jgi:hypothetical protein